MFRRDSIRRSVSRLRSLTRSREFRYEPLDTSNNEIRLLQLNAVQPSPTARRPSPDTTNDTQTEIITCTLINTPLTTVPPFTALSYTWGTRPATFTLLINNTPFLITSNVHQALLHLHKANHTHIWVDAICINQRDTSEKSIQILRLATVFRRADSVVSWIGVHDNLSGIVFDYLKSPEARGAKVSTDTNPFLKAALTVFAERDYWYRVWVVQEFAIAREVHVMCEDDIFDADQLDTLVIAYDKLCGQPGRLLLGPLPALTFTRDWQREKQNLGLLDILRHTLPLSGGDLIHATGRNRRRIFKSTDIIDQIYGLLGLVDDAGLFVPEPDYRLTMNELSLYILKSAVASTRRLDFMLLECGDKSLRHVDFGSKETREYKPSDLPSWCPDFVNILDSPLNAELTYGVFPKVTIPVNSIPQRHGQAKLSWTATAARSSKKDSYYFADDRSLVVRGKFLGSIASLEEVLLSLEGCMESEYIDEPLYWISELLLTYSDITPPSANEVLRVLPFIFDGAPCGCQESKAIKCSERRKATRTKLTDEPTVNDLAPYLMKLLAPSFGTSPIKADSQAVVWSSRENAIAHAIAYSTWLNYFFFRRKVMALVSDLVNGDVSITSGAKGRMGWMPVAVEPGDQVWLLSGCSMPVVLRKINDNQKAQPSRFVKTGPAVINNAMWGDMWEKQEPPSDLSWIAIV